MTKIGGILLAVGLGILLGWGLYWFFHSAFLSLPLPVKVAIAAIAVGLIILLASLGWERFRASKDEKEKFINTSKKPMEPGLMVASFVQALKRLFNVRGTLTVIPLPSSLKVKIAMGPL